MLLSGDQVAISSGAHQAIVTTVGATLRSYSVQGQRVIDGFEDNEVSPGGRGQVLMPWPNRIADGRYELGGQAHQLPLDETALGHAIHGLVRWRTGAWKNRRASTCGCGFGSPPGPGTPFRSTSRWSTACRLRDSR
jgi:aldose 1-epimerase